MYAMNCSGRIIQYDKQIDFDEGCYLEDWKGPIRIEGFVFIYGLCTDDGVIKYVGITIAPKNRLAQHRWNRQSNKKLTDWIKFLKENRKPIKMKLLFCVPNNLGDIAEEEMIRIGGQIRELYNILPGRRFYNGKMIRTEAQRKAM